MTQTIEQKTTLYDRDLTRCVDLKTKKVDLNYYQGNHQEKKQLSY
jgi:hypothetical protein